MKTLERIVAGLGSAGKNIHKEIYKAALKLLVDSNMTVRCSTSKVQRLFTSSCGDNIVFIENVALFCV